MIKNLKFIKIQGLREARRLGFGQKICTGGRDLSVLENLPWGW